MGSFRIITDPSTPANGAERLPDDLYLDGQDDDGIGGEGEAHALDYLTRLAHSAYLRLTNKVPGVRTLREYDASARGHDHDGADSAFIPHQIASHTRGQHLGHWGIAEAKDGTDIDRPAPTATFGGGALAFGLPDFGSFQTANALTTSYAEFMRWPRVWVGPGANRLDVSILVRTSGLITDPNFRLSNGTDTVTTVRGRPDYGWAWMHLTQSARLPVTPNALNTITLEAKVTGTGSDPSLLVGYGWSITALRE